MITGIGISELILILALVLLFFGSKELPHFIKQTASFMAKVRRYGDRMRRELDEIANPPPAPWRNSVHDKKQDLRKQYVAARAALDDERRVSLSKTILTHLENTPQFRNATTVMLYVKHGPEVDTREFIQYTLKQGKRVVLPYCAGSGEIRIGEIGDADRHLSPGAFGILEPIPEKRDNFFKTDLQLIVCPGVAFDRFGGRLGRGKRYYDGFLTEAKGKIPIFGLAFDCQIIPEPLPFEYHDVPMDQVITESGLLLNGGVPAGQMPPAVETGTKLLQE